MGEERVYKRKWVADARKRGVNAKQVGDVWGVRVHSRNIPY